MNTEAIYPAKRVAPLSETWERSGRLWFVVTVLMQVAAAAMRTPFSMINCVILIAWIFMPCSDKTFGNRGPRFWMRQTVLIVAAIVTGMLALL